MSTALRPCARCKTNDRDLSYQSYCRPCRNERWREWWEKSGKHDPKHVERRKAYSKKHNRKWKLMAYGLSLEDFAALKADQESRCAICNFEVELVVDHDHESGLVRGLLCKSCNTGIGMFRDNPDFLRSAISYLSGGQT